MYKALVEKSAASLVAQEDGFFKETFRRDALVNSAIDTVRDFDRDMLRLQQEAGILFATTTGDDNGARIAALFEKWRDDPPSACAIICAAAAHFDIPADNRLLKAAVMTGLAAEVDNENPYHSNHHFREVTAAIARLCNVHNELAAGGRPGVAMLESDSIAKCLIAGAGHDLMHDGKTNALNGPESHVQYRLENAAIRAIEPFMRLAGVPERDREDVRVMIRITDISAPQGGKSPHAFLKAAMRGETSGLPPELAGLAQDPHLRTLCALMSDADLGPSTATSFDYSRKMTTLLSRENPALADSNKTLSGFLQFVVGGTLTSDAGQTASQKTLDSIMQEAQKPDAPPPAPAPAQAAAKNAPSR
jgi:hypothetical protein